MIYITYKFLIILVSILWLTVRGISFIKHKGTSLKRELQLLLVYICLVVIVRIVFFPLEKINGMLQPLVFDPANAFPPKVNFIPFVHLTEYDEIRKAYINIIGNLSMFIPVGIIFPYVYKDRLDSHTKAISAGICFSLIIEILQLPFYDRVTDIDDLILNSTGYIIGYVVYIICRKTEKTS